MSIQKYMYIFLFSVFILGFSLNRDTPNLKNRAANNVVSSFQTRDVSIITSDNLTLKGTIHYLDTSADKEAGIVLMHHLMRSSNQWINTEILKNLVSQGYICLTFDFRGHGKSDSWEIDLDFSQGADIVIQNIKEYVEIYAKDDMISAVKFLRNHKKVDKNRIALIGGSLGANCAINGCNLNGVKAVVAMSPSTVGILPELELKNIFYLVGGYDDISNSGGPSYIEDTKKLFEHSAEPKKLFVLPQKSSHGLEYIGQLDVDEQIVNWINARIYNR